MQSPRQYVIIVAAGAGRRFGGDTPKQFLDLAGRPVCVRAAERFHAALPGCRIIFALPKEDFSHWQQFVSTAVSSDMDVIYVPGGETRWQSVRNSLDAIGEDAPPRSVVLVHDGARPLVDDTVIKAVCRPLLNTDGAIPAIPIYDSIRELDDDDVSSRPVDRSRFRAVQTPQGFTLWRLRQAYEEPYRPEFTDDASVLAASGFTNIVLVEGSRTNIKITTPEDLKIARCLISER